ncbi:protein kinase [Frankia sp. CNm7]|uniref:non-specific serine/threonine protein kinase n=1 Tax=Frankia nepalensis TaxID=1836974 RepID=A0A937RMU6_9ACTN|nr:serine/threonine-protein kinase [Frankia nepalensis]MBL7495329.1 protein kinase [Frankia nepalensis]MBL7516099.1 protein kinase [Frankia nepalensis]MBL7521934.1 protein kinase [Frankia nepalensis]MBL7633110.1 protein kinase [Frankia nepalensis]
MPTPVPDLVAHALPGYEIGAELGRGGFGTVLAARHRLMGRPVAVKVLLDAGGPAAASGGWSGPGGFYASDDPGDGTPSDLRSRFLSEAQVLAGLDHPHIVRVYDYVEYEGLCLLVMEQLTGGSLRSRVAGGLDPRASVAVGLAAATALATAHQIGVLHRDVKPDNLLFGADGVPRVTDFGIAKIVETTAVTATGLVGTPRYMAPEQIEGTRLGPGTDIYALGVVLYELLTGRPVFPRGLAVPALLHHHLAVAPQPMPEVPAPLAAAVLAMLAKSPADRPATAHELALRLAAAATSVFGLGWLTHAAVPVRLPEDVLTAAGHRLGETLPGQPTGWAPATPPPGATASLNTPPGTLPPTLPSTPPPGTAGRSSWQPLGGPPPPGGPGGGPGFPHPGGPPRGGPPPEPLARTRRGRRARPGPRRRTILIAGAAAAVCLVALGVGLVVANLGGGSRSGYSGETQLLRASALGAIAQAPDGSIFVVAPTLDPGAGAVYRLDADGEITKFAGVGPAPQTPGAASQSPSVGPTSSPSPTPFPAAGMPASELVLLEPGGLAAGKDGALYLADRGRGQVYRITPDGRAFLFAGAGPDEEGFTVDSGLATKAALSEPDALAVGPDGSLYLTEGTRVRKIDRDGFISTVAGVYQESGYEGDGGPATKATLTSPGGLAVARDGTVYVADAGVETVRKIAKDGIITTVAGIPGEYGHDGDGGPATRAMLYDPYGLAVDDAGDLYIADYGNDKIRLVNAEGVISTYAGAGSDGTGNGLEGTLATQAYLPYVSALLLDSSGALYGTLWDDAILLRVDPDNHVVHTVIVPPKDS